MSKPIECEDEYGEGWLVYKGDNGYSYIEKLNELGINPISLPRYFLLGLEEGDLKTPDISVSSGIMRDINKRLCRVYEAMQYL